MQPYKPHPSPIQEKKHYPHKYPNVKSNSSKRKTDCTLITTVRIWVMDSQNKTKRQSCPCLNIFLMKISGMFLSFSSEWLTKELEWEVHLGVPCLSDIVIEREREREREREWHIWLESRRRGAFWRLQIEPISLLIWYHYLWFHPRF